MKNIGKCSLTPLAVFEDVYMLFFVCLFVSPPSPHFKFSHTVVVCVIHNTSLLPPPFPINPVNLVSSVI